MINDDRSANLVRGGRGYAKIEFDPQPIVTQNMGPALQERIDGLERRIAELEARLNAEKDGSDATQKR